MATFKDEAVVLRTLRLGEADRIITFATPEHGKVRAVAKGVRKPKSKLAGRLEPFTYVSIMCWKGRELDIVTQAEVVDIFRPIREDIDRMGVAFTMLEAIDNIAVERHPMRGEFQLLVRALKTLSGDGGAALLGAFLWKLLALEGVGPVVDMCTSCGEDAPLVSFDEGVGGFLCRSCRSGYPVTEETVTLLRHILGGQLRSALAEPPSRATAEVERLATVAAEHHFGRRIRSAHMDSSPKPEFVHD